MPNNRLTTPVVFLIFNRPDTTTRVFAEIAKARPSRLLVIADGPRSDHPDDEQLCEATRAIIEQVDWDCEVSKNYAETNMGLRYRVSSGLDWAFDLVDEAIILEDDCLPHPDFFTFCTRMLDWYRDDTRIQMISGTNYVAEHHVAENGYFFSRFFAIWGWATWRRAWRKYDDDMSGWRTVHSTKSLLGLYAGPREASTLAKMFDAAMTKKVDSWDIHWFYSCLFNYGLTITPATNLVSNIGVSGTHTRRKPSRNHFLACEPLPMTELKKRQWVYPDVEYERRVDKIALKRPLHFRVLERLGIFDAVVSVYQTLRASGSRQ